MSTRVMGMVFDGGPEDLGQHSVLLALADNADDAGVAWPGDELLARKSRLSVRQLIRVRAALEAEGWFTVARRRRVVRDGEQRYGNLYQLNMAKLRTAAEAARKNRDEEREQQRHARKKRGDTVSREIADGVAKNGACETRRDMVSPEGHAQENEVTSEQNDMTPKSKRHDMAPAEVLSCEQDNFRNRHLTVMEPSSTPVIPASGDVRASGAAQFRAQREAKISAADRKAAELLWQSHRVLRELAISDERKQQRLLATIGDALDLHCERMQCAPIAAADLAVSHVRRFLAERSLMRHGWGWARFFSEGYWAKPELWPYDHQALRESQKQGAAAVGIWRSD